ncbi:MAG TPA: prepilin peptidase [Rhodospirillales bacterium]|jgi:prepilin peptidase CpaA|nr:prepilin peptidase [Rhodospirillales bacterium]
MHAIVSLDFLVVTLFLGLLGLAVVTDLEAMRIPNRICLAIAALYPVHVLAAAGPADWPLAVAAAAAVFAFGLIPFCLGLMGGGDVKLMAAAALWAGPAGAVDFVLVTTFLGGVMALVMVSPYRFAVAVGLSRIGRDDIGTVLMGRVIPYAVAIAAGAWLTIGPPLVRGIG